MSFRKTVLVLVVAWALLGAPASFGAEEQSGSLWQAFTNWLATGLGLADLEVDSNQLGSSNLVGEQPQDEGGHLILPGG